MAAPRVDSFDQQVEDSEAELWSCSSMLEVAGDGRDSSATVRLGFGFRAK